MQGQRRVTECTDGLQVEIRTNHNDRGGLAPPLLDGLRDSVYARELKLANERRLHGFTIYCGGDAFGFI
jgi:hypothetical protein